jgi:hypothetical protein
MHFVDSWTGLPLLRMVMLLAPAAIALVAMLLPGRAVARTASFAVGLVLLPAFDLGPLWLRFAWMALWVGVGAVSGVKRDASVRDEAPRPGGMESGAVGLMLGAAILVLLIVALGRQDLRPEQTRPAAIGLVLIVIGVAHLMLRRDALRGAMAFATMGLGLQWLDRAVRHLVIESSVIPEWVAMSATAAAVVLAARVALTRQRDAGSAWVHHAHDLHD